MSDNIEQELKELDKRKEELRKKQEENRIQNIKNILQKIVEQKQELERSGIKILGVLVSGDIMRYVKRFDMPCPCGLLTFGHEKATYKNIKLLENWNLDSYSFYFILENTKG